MAVDEGTAGALDMLVNQFGDPLAFLRELIQNALDAGSTEIDVWMEFEPNEQDPDGLGAMEINVDDYGEGMDLNIIRTKLTRLFSSTKDGDMTKIGKFCIGFVSVFAIQPQAVVVTTARANEQYQIVFAADRSFEIFESDDVVEGTKIKLIKAVTQSDFDDFERRVHNTVVYWCKHAEAEIRFQDEPGNQSFGVQTPIQVEHAEQGTRVIAGYLDTSKQSFAGFYNKGLTLLERHASEFPGVAFKISSRYFEHTLTRDKVIEDNNYRKAIKIVGRLVNQVLPERIFKELDRWWDTDHDDTTRDHLWRQAHRLAARGNLPKSVGSTCLARSLSGQLLTLTMCQRALKKEQLWSAPLRSQLTDEFEEQGHVVISSYSPALNILGVLDDKRKPQALHRYWAMPRPPEASELKSWQPLRQALLELLSEQGVKLTGVELAHFNELYSGISGWVAMTQEKPGEPTPLAEARLLSKGSFFSKRRLLVLNMDHPTLQQLQVTAHIEPELAAYTLVKMFFLEDKTQGASAAMDANLGAIAVRLRSRRQQASSQ